MLSGVGLSAVGVLLLRSLAALWLLGCTALAAHRLALLLTPRAAALERLVAWGICGIWLATCGFHLLAALRAFHLVAALLVATALGAVTFAADRRSWRRMLRSLRLTRRLGVLIVNGRQRWLGRCFCVCAAPVVLRPWLLPPLGWDTLTYHATKAALWIQNDGALPMDAPGPWFFYGQRWAGASILTSWAMLPFHSDLIATGQESFAWLLLGAALWGLLRALRVREPLAGAAAAFALSLPALRLLVGSGYDEPVTCLCVVAGCLFGVRLYAHGRMGAALLSAAALGLALGMKLTFARSSVWLGVGTCVFLFRRRPWRQALALLGACAVVAAAALAPWMIAALRRGELPLSPLPAQLFGVQLGEAAAELRWYMARPALYELGPRAELHTLGVLFGDFGHGREVPTVLALLPVALAPFGVLLSSPRQRLPALLLMAACVGDLWSYASGELTVVRLRYFDTMGRFLLVALFCAITLSTLWSSRFERAGRAYAYALFACALVLLVRYAPVGVSQTGASATLMAAVVSIVFVLAWRASKLRRRALTVALRALALAALIISLDTARERLRYVFMTQEFAIHPHPTYWVPSAQALDEPSAPKHIAVTGGPHQDMDRWCTYPFFGSQLQNRLSYVSPLRGGELRHIGSPDDYRGFYAAADASGWLQRLRAGHVSHVLSFDPPSLELQIMQDNPRWFRRISSPSLRAFAVFELLPTTER